MGVIVNNCLVNCGTSFITNNCPFSHTIATNADISMQTSSLSVSEDTPSISVCAVINGVAGNVEEAVTATLTLTGSTKAGKDCALFGLTTPYELKTQAHKFRDH